MPVNYVTFTKQTCERARPLHSKKWAPKKYRNNDLPFKVREPIRADVSGC